MMPDEIVKNQAQFIRRFNDKYREPFNDALFERSDEEIIDMLKKVILSCERSKYFTLKVQKFTVIDDYSTIIKMLAENESVKSKSKDKRFNQYEYISLKDSAIRLLVVDYYIKIKYPKKNLPSEDNVRVLIMVPRFVDKYYFYLQGNYYYLKYQIVDGSTYNNMGSSSRYQAESFKSLFMATRLYKYNITFYFESNIVRPGVYYNSNIFSKSVPVQKYILAKYGLYYTLQAFGLVDLRLSDVNPRDPEMYTLKKHNVFISVPKFLFDNDTVLQSLVWTIYCSITSKDVSYKDLFTPEYWKKSLGESYGNKTASIAKGESVLESLESIYDIITKDALRLPDVYKSDIYHVLIWVVREYAELRQKNNLDVSVKRYRLAEYVAVKYALKLSKGVLKFQDEGENIQISSISKRINTFPDYLIKDLMKDQLMSSRNSVNDMDAFNALKWSYKGASGLGESKDTTVPECYKQAHPSHLGRIDLDSSMNNEPGMSGIICPMADTFDNYFSDFNEPNMWREEVRELLEEYRKLKGLKEVVQMKKTIGITPKFNEEGSIDESIQQVEMILPVVMNIDASNMTSVGKVTK